MDLLYGAYYLALFALPIVAYIAVSAENVRKKKNRYSKPEWYHFLKVHWAKPKVKEFQEECKRNTASCTDKVLEDSKELPPGSNLTDTQLICGSDLKKNSVIIKIIRRECDTIEVCLQLRLKNRGLFVLPSHPEVTVLSEHSGQFHGHGLIVTVVRPFTTLRITFNGFLRNIDGDVDEVQHAQFNIIWNSGGRPLFCPQDYNCKLLANSIASETWRDGNWIELLGDEQGYEQFGVLKTLLRGDAFEKEIELSLPCMRKRYWGTTEARYLYRNFNIFGIGEDGTCISLGAKSLLAGCSQLQYGLIRLPNSNTKAIDESDIHLESLGEHGILPPAFVLHFKVEKRTFKLVVHCDLSTTAESYNNECDGWEMKTCRIECGLDNQQLQGVASFWYCREGTYSEKPAPLVRPLTIFGLEGVFVGALASRECRSLSLAGGKGNSLALLSSISTDDFIVPDGFVVFTTALKHQIFVRNELQDALKHLEDVYSGKVEGNLQETCDKTLNAFKTTQLDASIAEEIRQQIVETQGTDTLKFGLQNGEGAVRWAVRSSGVGEDTDELSAAGQNATYLGMSSVEDVLNAVAACWGSLYAYQSVQYRKQHGQPLISDMGVVVQKMIPADVAGVIFTCHPSTGHLGKMVVTANYGLGESVVSAHADPDTIILTKTWQGEVAVEHYEIGEKKRQILMTADVSGTEETATATDLRNRLCLIDEQAILLGKIGVRLEKEFGSPRDIEWAFHDGQLYMLQSRPVTTLNAWTDFELLHEFDAPTFSKQDLYTTANVGEVLSGATTCLAHSILAKCLEENCQVDAMYAAAVDPYVSKCIVTVQHHLFLNVMNIMFANLDKKLSIENQITDAAVFGRVVVNEKYHKIANNRYGPMKSKRKLQRLFNMLSKCWNASTTVSKVLDYSHNFSIPRLDGKTALEMYKIIDEKLAGIDYTLGAHQRVSQASIFYQVFSMVVLAGDSESLNNSHYLDIATFLSNCTDVVSAEVPTILEKISKIICNAGLKERFLQVEPKVGVEWLKENCLEAANAFQEFLKKHGHRGIGEFDFNNVTWGMDPSSVIKMLQANVKNPFTNRNVVNLSPSETVDKLVGANSKIARFILKWFVKKSRAAVQNREITKSELIRTVHKIRLALMELSNKMVSEGFLPREELLFHLTHTEIGQLLETRDSTLIAKSTRRHRLYSKWDKMSFPEIMEGEPRAVDSNDAVQVEGGARIVGTPVYTGVVMGRACVITDLEDIGQLQSGDVLITTATDIGWSPYFPLLSAVVTELGGLISHGAVVAREYGLPCIVGAQKATKVFATGDMVRLDGFTGIVEKIK